MQQWAQAGARRLCAQASGTLNTDALPAGGEKDARVVRGLSAQDSEDPPDHARWKPI